MHGRTHGRPLDALNTIFSDNKEVLTMKTPYSFCSFTLLTLIISAILSGCGPDLAGDGGSCILDSDCESNVCILDKCELWLADKGESCQYNDDCSSNICLFASYGKPGYCSDRCNTTITCPGVEPVWACEMTNEISGRVCVQK